MMAAILVLCVLLGTEVVLVYSVLWTKIPGNLNQVDAGLTGAVWGVNSTDQIWKLNSQGTEWTNVPGSLKHVTAGEGGFWGVSSGDRIWYREGSVADSLGSSWTSVSGGLTQITSGPYGVVYGVNSNDDIYCRTGITDSKPKGTGWKHIGGKLKYVSCGGLGCWGVNSGNQIFFRYGVSRQNPAGTSWAQIPGILKQIESGPSGRVWAVNTADQVFYRAGISQSKPTGSHWVSVAGSLKHVSVGCSGLYGVSKDGRAWRYTGSVGFSKSKCVKKAQIFLMCEGHSGRISCGNGKSIKVVWANYGRTVGAQTCPGAVHTRECKARSTLDKVRQLCEGKTTCSLSASNSLVGDPCRGTRKYLEVHYTCGAAGKSPGTGIQTGQIVGLAFGIIFLACFCNGYRNRIRERFCQQRNADVHQNPLPTAATQVDESNNRAGNNRAGNSRARNHREAPLPSSPPLPPQATTKTPAYSAPRDLPPPPPFQDSCSVPEQPPPSYDEAMRMENSSVLYYPGGRGGETQTS